MVQIEAKLIRFPLADEGRVLATREKGLEAGEQIRRVAADGGDLVLDFGKIEVASAPYLQEIINAVQGILASAGEEGRIVVLTHMNDDVESTMGYVVDKKKLTVPYGNAEQVCLLEATEAIAITFRAAQQLGSFTAPELASMLELNDDAATKRLTKLMSSGAVRRERDPDARQGVRHIYQAASVERMSSLWSKDEVAADRRAGAGRG